jgi:predicted  nucleic acid-binding Zn-ribbon protein
MNEEFINTYIEMNNKKIEELTRSEILLQTRIVIAEKAVTKLNEEKKGLSDDLENFKEVQLNIQKEYSEKNKELFNENQDLINQKKMLLEEIESLKQAITLVSENQKKK